MHELRFLSSDLNAAGVLLASMIVLFIIRFKIRMVDLTGGVPTEMAPF